MESRDYFHPQKFDRVIRIEQIFALKMSDSLSVYQSDEIREVLFGRFHVFLFGHGRRRGSGSRSPKVNVGYCLVFYFVSSSLVSLDSAIEFLIEADSNCDSRRRLKKGIDRLVGINSSEGKLYGMCLERERTRANESGRACVRIGE